MEGINQAFMINKPFFDFVEAEESGFDFNSFKNEGFKVFVKSSLLRDFIKIRRNYIIRDFISVRYIANKLKGCFR
jgi:hypothetical protein